MMLPPAAALPQHKLRQLLPDDGLHIAPGCMHPGLLEGRLWLLGQATPVRRLLQPGAAAADGTA